jgi:hypothetical protein
MLTMTFSRAIIRSTVPLALLLFGVGCGNTASSTADPKLTVNSLEDSATPASGTVTLRSAIAAAGSGDRITFASSLSGRTILLSIVGEPHTTLPGEAYSGMSFLGYQDRDYGASAIYARKDVVIDASALPAGITITWNGGDQSPARVLAVYGNLRLVNVRVTGGHSSAEAIPSSTQPYTLARGGGLAVWGTLALEHSTVAGNRCTGDPGASRDRGTYGGGIYANGLSVTDSVVSGNTAVGYGAAGGGIYSVGGADHASGSGNDTVIARSAITGNRVTGQHSYGGGIFTLSGGPANLATMYVTSSTIARNLVEDNPDLPDVGQYYHRGGGIYMGGGSLSLVGSTVAENAVTGPFAIFSGAPNVGGGGIAATIGNAHTVEYAWLQGSAVVGNTLNGAPEDWFAGSLLFFNSEGYNLLGNIDFRYILVPVPDWMMLNRKRWPEVGDQEGVTIAQALDVAGAATDATIASAGTDAGQPAVLWYPPADLARNKIPAGAYSVTYVSAGYSGFGAPTDDFLNYLLRQVRTVYPETLGPDFGASYGDLTGTTWYESLVTWPSDPRNAAWIAFWRGLDQAIAGRLGMAGLNDDFWGTFTSGPLGSHIEMSVRRDTRQFARASTDQLGTARPTGSLADIGAIER